MQAIDNLPEINVAKPESGKKKKGFLPLLFGGGGAVTAKSAGMLISLALTVLTAGTSIIISHLKTSSRSGSLPPAVEATGKEAPGSTGKAAPEAVKETAEAGGSSENAGGSVSEAGASASDSSVSGGDGGGASGAEPAAGKPESASGASDAGAASSRSAAKMTGTKKIGELTSQLGQNRLQFGTGNFSNKFGNTFGPEGIGSGGVMGEFQRPMVNRNKLLAMKGSARPVMSRGALARAGAGARGAHSQAKAIRGGLNYLGTNVDSAKGTVDKAWEGSTGVGQNAGGGGIVPGLTGGGVAASPSLDNTKKPVEKADKKQTPVVSGKKTDEVTPWAELAGRAGILLGIATVAIGIISALSVVPDVTLKGIAAGLALIVAGALASYVSWLGYRIMTEYHEAYTGLAYITAGMVTAGAAAVALTGRLGGPATALTLTVVSGVIQTIIALTSGK